MIWVAAGRDAQPRGPASLGQRVGAGPGGTAAGRGPVRARPVDALRAATGASEDAVRGRIHRARTRPAEVLRAWR
jgi:hypothetical protein